jgi:hemerythrin
VVARILTDLDAAANTEDTQQVRSTLDRLTTELEEHFAYEEKHLVGVLNSLTGPAPWEAPDS